MKIKVGTKEQFLKLMKDEDVSEHIIEGLVWAWEKFFGNEYETKETDHDWYEVWGEGGERGHLRKAMCQVIKE